MQLDTMTQTSVVEAQGLKVQESKEEYHVLAGALLGNYCWHTEPVALSL